jgi:hypothetical protein
MKTSAISGLAVALATLVLPRIAYGQALPSTEEFQSLVTLCAHGSDLQIDTDIIGSVTSIYRGERTKGVASLKSQTRFLELFPAEDRLDAAKLYQECIIGVLNRYQSSQGAQSVSGRYVATSSDRPGMQAVLEIQSGSEGTFSGTLALPREGHFIVDGRAIGDAVTFEARDPVGYDFISFEGKFTGGSIRGHSRIVSPSQGDTPWEPLEFDRR